MARKRVGLMVIVLSLGSGQAQGQQAGRGPRSAPVVSSRIVAWPEDKPASQPESEPVLAHFYGELEGALRFEAQQLPIPTRWPGFAIIPIPTQWPGLRSVPVAISAK